MSVRITLRNRSLTFKQAMSNDFSRIARATTGAARFAASEILRLGRTDIAQAGRFGPRWQESLTVDVAPKSGALINARITVAHKIPYASVFETGAIIRGNPLLWIPFSSTGIRIRARDYAAAFGGLARVDRSGGVPLLISIRDHRPKYFGLRQVDLRKRFHLGDIVTNVMANFGAYYAANLKV